MKARRLDRFTYELSAEGKTAKVSDMSGSFSFSPRYTVETFVTGFRVWDENQGHKLVMHKSFDEDPALKAR